MTEIDFGVLTPLIQNANVARISVLAPDNIRTWNIQIGQERVDIKFDSEADVRALAEHIAQTVDMPFDYKNPIVDIHLAGGIHIMLISSYVSSGGTIINIEKSFDDGVTVEKLINFGALSQSASDFLMACVKGHRKIAFFGGVHSGRKTGMNAFARYLYVDAPIVIIQPFNRIQLPDHTHVVKLERQDASYMQTNQLNNGALLDAGLRLRPHRLIISDLDGTEIHKLLNAMQNGLNTFFSMSATSADDMLARLETMATANNFSRPVMAIREQIAEVVDVIVHVDLMYDGLQRFISITAVEGMQADTIHLETIFDRENGIVSGDMIATGNVPQRTIQRLETDGVEIDLAWFK